MDIDKQLISHNEKLKKVRFFGAGLRIFGPTLVLYAPNCIVGIEGSGFLIACPYLTLLNLELAFMLASVDLITGQSSKSPA